MFSKKGNDSFQMEGAADEKLQDTIIAQGVKVEGDFKSRGNVIIEGAVVGSIKTTNNLQVGEKANISANVEATNAHISGTVEGNVRIKEKLELSPTSRVYGDIEAKILIINAGAVLNGKCQMADPNAPAPQKTDKKSKKDEDEESVAEEN
jgi:cytoskeletal protein CcmA (bactofilin family)